MNLEKIIDRLLNWIVSDGIKLIIGLIVLYVGWKLINKLIKGVKLFLEKKNIDATLVSFLDAFTDISLKALLVLIVMNYIGIDTAGLAALIASAGLAVGLALQGSLSNFAGGVVILLIRPFNIGDFIETNGYSGTVESIRIFYTHLLTPDNKVILIPNGVVANGSLVNYSSKDTRRVDLIFGVGYESNILHVRKSLSEVINNNKMILRYPESFIGITEHGSSSVNFVVRVWCNTEDYWTVYFDLLENVKIKFDEEEISIPYPQMDLHITK